MTRGVRVGLRRIMAAVAVLVLVAPAVLVVASRLPAITGSETMSLSDRSLVASTLLAFLLLLPVAGLALLYASDPCRRGSWWLLPATFACLSAASLVRGPVAIMAARDPAEASLFDWGWSSLISGALYLLLAVVLWLVRPSRAQGGSAPPTSAG